MGEGMAGCTISFLGGNLLNSFVCHTAISEKDRPRVAAWQTWSVPLSESSRRLRCTCMYME